MINAPRRDDRRDARQARDGRDYPKLVMAGAPVMPGEIAMLIVTIAS
ncbi:MAG: hypothetical protein L0Z50_33620 [Verrucomicrobiales bacterium]|nr:hypothetical protein [Verrucomicrobiales bacterium]